jgi:hypothetical protein
MYRGMSPIKPVNNENCLTTTPVEMLKNLASRLVIDPTISKEDPPSLPTTNIIDDIVSRMGYECGGGGGREGGDIVETTNLFGDIELFNDKTENDTDGMASANIFDSVVDHTLLRFGRGGRSLLRRILEHPTTDISLLLERQRPSMSIGGDLVKVRQEMIDNEHHMVWMWDFLSNPDKDVRALYDTAYFSNWFLTVLNRSSKCLTLTNMYKIFAAPLIGIITPIIYFFVPYAIFRIRLGIRISFRDYLRMLYSSIICPYAESGSEPFRTRATRYISIAFSLVFYFQGIFSSIEVSAMLRKVCASVTERMEGVTAFAKATTGAWEASGWDARAWAGGDGYWPGVPPAGEATKSEKALSLEEPSDCIAKYGHTLRVFRGIKMETVATLLYRAYALDAMQSVIAMKNAFSCVPVTFSSETGAGPVLSLKGVWYPMIPKAFAISNDWILSNTGSVRNALLTGPNAGGKSTLMKGTLLSVLMAQTLGVAPCRESMTISPFYIISSHINVPDSQVRGESLFEAEMKRAKECVSLLERARTNNKFALVVMDEIFSSTNPVEGIAGAFATAKKLATFDNTINIISTHYTYLAKLANVKNANNYKAYKMPVIISESGNIEKPYRLQTGVSTQYVALEIMRSAGIDDDIVRDAIHIKNEMIRTAAAGKPSRVKNPKQLETIEKVESVKNNCIVGADSNSL